MVQRLTDAAKPRPSVALERPRGSVIRLVREHRASNPRVFGSVARKEDHAGSDLDLLVRFDKHASLYDLVELQGELRDLLGVPVDVVSEGGLKDAAGYILREARPL